MSDEIGTAELLLTANTAALDAKLRRLETLIRGIADSIAEYLDESDGE